MESKTYFFLFSASHFVTRRPRVLVCQRASMNKIILTQEDSACGSQSPDYTATECGQRQLRLLLPRLNSFLLQQSPCHLQIKSIINFSFAILYLLSTFQKIIVWWWCWVEWNVYLPNLKILHNQVSELSSW